MVLALQLTEPLSRQAGRLKSGARFRIVTKRRPDRTRGGLPGLGRGGRCASIPARVPTCRRALLLVADAVQIEQQTLLVRRRGERA